MSADSFFDPDRRRKNRHMYGPFRGSLKRAVFLCFFIKVDFNETLRSVPRGFIRAGRFGGFLFGFFVSKAVSGLFCIFSFLMIK